MDDRSSEIELKVRRSNTEIEDRTSDIELEDRYPDAAEEKYTKTEKDEEELKPKLVVAIDFGTYACGYAFQRREDYEKANCLDSIKVPSNIGDNQFHSRKLGTCILLRPDKSVHKFGFDADFEFNRIESLNEDKDKRPPDWKDWYFFKHFKMRLYTDGRLGLDTPIEAANNKYLPAVEIISITIKYIKDKAVENIQRAGYIYKDEETKWVITVPAIWKDSAKNVMHEAAEKAGINGKNLSLALEPECAALYTSKLPFDDLKITNTDVKQFNTDGQTFTVLDIGGGTVDMTTFQVKEDKSMIQLQKSGGGPWGGETMNSNFEMYMKTLIGEKAMKILVQKNQVEYFDLRMAIEDCKRMDCLKDEIRLKIPDVLKTIWEEMENNTVDEILKQRTTDVGKIKFQVGRLWFDKEIIQSFFEYIISHILKLIKENVLERDLRLDCLLLVGGIAGSMYVVEKIRSGLSEHGVPVVVPYSPDTTVLTGAVLFGQNESIIASRVMRYTYGVAMTMEFNPKMHKEEEKYEIDGKGMANNVFRKHVTIGDSVKTDKWIASKEYHPESDEATYVTIYIFTSNKKDPIHTTEEGCEYLGSVDIEFGKKLDGGKTGVSVEFNFGGTELRVRAITLSKDNTSIRLRPGILKYQDEDTLSNFTL